MITSRELDPKANRSFTLISGPSCEPVSVDELKIFARIDGDDEDSLLESFITAVRISIEAYTWRAIIEQQWRMRLDWWPGDVVEIPRSPLISIDSVKTVNEDSSETTYSSGNYFVITDAEPGKLVIKNGAEWPSNEDRYHGGFQIDFTCGYGSAASNVPEGLRTAIMQWATAVYENRAMTGTPPPEVKTILNPYRLIWY